MPRKYPGMRSPSATCRTPKLRNQNPTHQIRQLRNQIETACATHLNLNKFPTPIHSPNKTFFPSSHNSRDDRKQLRSPADNSLQGVISNPVIMAEAAIAAALFLLLLLCTGICLKTRKLRRRATCCMPKPEALQGLREFSYRELAEATKNFADSNILDRGRFGSVYKGVLLDGQMVAVRKAGSICNEFVRETEIMSQIRHRHVVLLLGYYRGLKGKYFVYEYFHNGSLNSQLHSQECLDKVLDWPTRMKIALGVARALTYFHEELCLVHNDVISANVLLNSEFDPLIADFGLGKFECMTKSTYNKKFTWSYGYLSPEYITSGYPTMESDVYSFGVLLLELVTGQIASSNPNEGNKATGFTLVDSLGSTVSQAVKERNPSLLVDPKLGTDFDETEAMRIIGCAASAINSSPEKRPRIREIARVLEGDLSFLSDDAGNRQAESGILWLPRISSVREYLDSDLQDGTDNEFQDTEGGSSVDTESSSSMDTESVCASPIRDQTRYQTEISVVED